MVVKFIIKHDMCHYDCTTMSQVPCREAIYFDIILVPMMFYHFVSQGFYHQCHLVILQFVSMCGFLVHYNSRPNYLRSFEHVHWQKSTYTWMNNDVQVHMRIYLSYLAVPLVLLNPQTYLFWLALSSSSEQWSSLYRTVWIKSHSGFLPEYQLPNYQLPK